MGLSGEEWSLPRGLAEDQAVAGDLLVVGAPVVGPLGQRQVKKDLQ